MKPTTNTKLLALLAVSALNTFSAAAQEPPPPLSPPAPPVAPVPPVPAPPPKTHPGRHHEGMFLGVDVSPVPAALSDQLNLAEGFGLLVDYVVPGSAADTAGIKKNDILKLLNDQILTSPRQLAVLVRSFTDGQEIGIVAIRKGQETKLTAKLQKQTAEEHRPGRWPANGDEEDDDLDGYLPFTWEQSSNPEVIARLHESLERSREQTKAAMERAREQLRQNMENLRRSGLVGSRLDFDGAQIILRDASGNLEIRSKRGKRTLTVKTPDGKVEFEGPINTPEERKRIPANVLPQVEQLEREQAGTFPPVEFDDFEGGPSGATY